MATLAIDIGSSFVKAMVLGNTEPGLEPSRVPMPPPVSDHRDRHELDPDRVQQLVTDLVRARIATDPHIDRLVIGTQMHSFVLTDHEDIATSPIITWQDRRAMDSAPGPAGRRIRERFADGWQQRSGLPPRPGLPALTLAHWADQHGSTARLRFHTIGSFVASALTGAHRTHLTNAAATGLVDLTTGQWDDRAVASATTDGIVLPQIVDTPVVAPIAHRAIEVWPDVGDHQATIRGTEAALGDIVVSLGTAGLVSRLTRIGDHCHGEIRPYRPGIALDTVTGLPGGRLLQQWVEQRLATTGHSREQLWQELDHGLPGDLADRFRAALGSAIAQLLPTGAAVARLHLSGGAARRTPALVDILTDLMPAEKVVLHTDETSLTGLLGFCAEPVPTTMGRPT